MTQRNEKEPDEDSQLIGEAKMRAMAVAPPEPPERGRREDGPRRKDEQRREDEELDEGLGETFPASDPPANTQPGHDRPVPSSGEPRRNEERPAKE